MPFNNVTVFYGPIHQEHHHQTGHIAHHAAKLHATRRRALCWGAAGWGALLAGVRATAADTPRIQVTARKFQFTPNPIVIPRGVDVIL